MNSSKHLNSGEGHLIDQRLTLLLRGIEVAKELGISRALAYRWLKNGTLPAVRVPGSKAVRCPRAALLEWIETRTQRAVNQ